MINLTVPSEGCGGGGGGRAITTHCHVINLTMPSEGCGGGGVGTITTHCRFTRPCLRVSILITTTPGSTKTGGGLGGAGGVVGM